MRRIAAQLPWLFNLRDRRARGCAAVGGDRRLCRAAQPAALAQRCLPRSAPTGRRRRRMAVREVVLFADTFNRYFERENLDAAHRGADRRRLSRPCRRSQRTASARPLCCGRTFLVGRRRSRRRKPRSRAHARRAGAFRRARRAGDRARAELPVHASATKCRRCSKARRRTALAANCAACSRNSWRANSKDGRLDLPLGAARQRRRCCTAIATRRRSTPWARSSSVLKLVPELAVETDRIRAAAAWRALRLRRRHHRCVARDGRAVAAAGGAQSRRRHADRRRRHLLPASDPRRHRPRRRCMSRACWR